MKYKPYKNEFGMKKKEKIYSKNFFFIIHSLKNQNLNILLQDLPFYDELSAVEISKHLEDMQGVIKLK